jgi:lipoic acid synthetase
MASRLPDWLIKRVPKQQNIRLVRELIGDDRVHTVCEEAKCPNIGECYANRTCTFMILGDVCSRNCAFCAVASGQPQPVDPAEPERVAAAVKKLGLNYVVITSVTRDDLPDGGASQFAAVIRSLLVTRYSLQIEVLIPDFQGDTKALKAVLDAKPTVLNHNIETVPRLYPTVRPQAIYQRSLDLLAHAKRADSSIYTKSGFMVGLGETKEEVATALQDLKAASCDIVTIGQYLPPSRAHLQPARYVTPAEFNEYEKIGRGLGLLQVSSGPFVRSSYHAGEIRNEISAS